MCFLTEDHLQLCMTTSFLKFHRNAQFHKSVKSWIRLLHIHHTAYQQWQLGTCIAGLHMYYCIHWKASEWRSFLVFYSVACFKHVMPATYYSHWLLLVFSLDHLHTDKHRNATKQVPFSERKIFRYQLMQEQVLGPATSQQSSHQQWCGWPKILWWTCRARCQLPSCWHTVCAEVLLALQTWTTANKDSW